MASWVLVPCLVALRAELDRCFPQRQRTSDGSIGDQAHAGTVSDHNPDETGSVPIHDADNLNEVHAIDVDVDLEPQQHTIMRTVVDFLVRRCRLGLEKRLRYIIYDRTIWSASNGWRPAAYTGANPHTEHAHFSASYETYLEGNTQSWHLEEIPVALTESDKNFITSAIHAEVAKLLQLPIGDAANPRRTLGDVARDFAKLRGALVGDPRDTANAALTPTAPISQMMAAAHLVVADHEPVLPPPTE